MLYNYVKSQNQESLTLFFDYHDDVVLSPSHPAWDEIIDLMEDDELELWDDDDVLDILNETEASQWVSTVEDERFNRTPHGTFLDGIRISEDIAQGVEKLLGEYSEDPNYLMAISRFLEKAESNPSMINSENLYRWLFAEGLTLTSDGDFIGYKSVTTVNPYQFNNTFGSVTRFNGDVETSSEVLPTDKVVYQASFPGGGITDGYAYSGHVPSYVGAVVEMPRDQVNPDGSVECSVGLHVGTYRYASSFTGDNIILVKVNPKDAVSVPDRDFHKLRVCRYTVVAEGQANYLDSRMYIEDQYAPILGDPVQEEELADPQKRKSFVGRMVSSLMDSIKRVSGK